MSPSHEPLTLSSEELAILTELLESERSRLLVEIRHTDHRAYRDALHHKLDVVEELVRRCEEKASQGAARGPGSPSY
jgi:hypothetical protein